MSDINNLDDFDNIEDLRKELEKRIKAHNEDITEDFEGLSPVEMHALHYDFPSKQSPLTLNTLPDKKLEQCPLLMQVRFLIDLMKGENTLQLTKTGALNTKLVKDLYALGYLKSEWIENGRQKLYKESDAPTVSITRILLELSSLTKKRHGKLSLTKRGEKLVNDNNAILKELISVLFKKFNWGYFDGFESDNIGAVNPAYSLYLLKKYGEEKRNTDFYADRYFKAFPMLFTDGKNPYRCYAVRTFERYFRYLGLLKIQERKILDPYIIQKTPFLDALISYNSDDNS